jgi:RND family efflux transporter MFP subunit
MALTHVKDRNIVDQLDRISRGASRVMRILISIFTGAAACMAIGASPSFAEGQTVKLVAVDDRKAVIATVEPVHQFLARARIPGTVTRLTVKEGNLVSEGDRIALAVDEKLRLQMEALQARIQAQEADREQARLDFGRMQQLRGTGAVSQKEVDQARTHLEAAEQTLQALKTDRQVIEEQAAQGAVLAPGAGRVLKVPVTDGSVVMSGDTIAVIAAENYILRLQLPERHARFMKAGDMILVGSRGLQTREEEPETLRHGKVVLVYPEIDHGRVIADVKVEGLGDYFVGERTRVYVATGARQALVIPEGYLYRRFGVSYVKLEDGTEAVVQPGLPVEGGVEILAGLHEGDVVIKP